jgi:quinolinate synthase
MELDKFQLEIIKIAKEKGILLLAHSYQPIEVQQVADFVGDSLELSIIAKNAKEQKIMFAAVKFMAETAKVLSPEKKIMIANPDAGCPLANMINPEDVLKLKTLHPGAPVVCYINTPIEVKAVSNVICTSANALKICESLPENEIIFVPDQGLGSWIAEKTSKKIWLHSGFCHIHWLLDVEDIKKAKLEHPESLLVVHPESNPKIRALADYVCGTSAMIRYVKENPGRSFIIGTEIGMMQRLQTVYPDVTFYLASKKLVCPNMKKTDCLVLKDALENETSEVTLDKEMADKARKAIQRMHDQTA